MSYTLRDFGSYTVGGRVHEVTEGQPRLVQFTRTANYSHDPRGHFAVEHAYVQYFVPEPRNSEPPVILVHGGGMTGSCWETTPDERPGWLQLLLKRGFEVHVVDNVERGRSGFVPDLWDGAPILRSMEEAWVLFRIGSRDGYATRTPFAGQKFPADHFETFARIFVPRWLHTTPLQTAALVEVLRKTGPAIVICHSQGGEITFDAQARAPELFHTITALEPSGYPDKVEVLGETPVKIIAGDYLDSAPHSRKRLKDWTALGRATPNITFTTAAGHSHMLMMDRNCEQLLDTALGT